MPAATWRAHRDRSYDDERRAGPPIPPIRVEHRNRCTDYSRFASETPGICKAPVTNRSRSVSVSTLNFALIGAPLSSGCQLTNRPPSAAENGDGSCNRFTGSKVSYLDSQ